MSTSEVIVKTATSPEWLNQTFLENILSKHYKNSEVKVKSFEIKPATGKGDSFTSSIFKVHVNIGISSNGSQMEDKVRRKKKL